MFSWCFQLFRLRPSTYRAYIYFVRVKSDVPTLYRYYTNKLPPAMLLCDLCWQKTSSFATILGVTAWAVLTGLGVSLTFCCFVVYSTRRFIWCLTLCCFSLVFFSPFSIAITSPGKSELILVLSVRLLDLCLFGFVDFLFLLVSGKGCGLWLWHSLDFSPTFLYLTLILPSLNCEIHL